MNNKKDFGFEILMNVPWSVHNARCSIHNAQDSIFGMGVYWSYPYRDNQNWWRILSDRVEKRTGHARIEGLVDRRSVMNSKTMQID
jgi:hypothetical protein